MQHNSFTSSPKRLARQIGGWYFLIIACGLFSGMVVREALIDPSNGPATLANIQANESLFRLGFLADLLMVIGDVMVSLLFYFLLKPVHRGLATLAAGFRLLQSAVLAANLVHLFQPLLTIQIQTGSPSTAGSLPTELLLQLQTFEYGYLISGVFFAVNCALMGVLLYRSGFFPKTLGIMLGLAAFGYAFNCLAHFILPSLIEVSEVVMLCTAVVAELSFCLYLLVKGIKTKVSLPPA